MVFEFPFPKKLGAESLDVPWMTGVVYRLRRDMKPVTGSARVTIDLYYGQSPQRGVSVGFTVDHILIALFRARIFVDGSPDSFRKITINRYLHLDVPHVTLAVE